MSIKTGKMGYLDHVLRNDKYITPTTHISRQDSGETRTRMATHFLVNYREWTGMDTHPLFQIVECK